MSDLQFAYKAPDVEEHVWETEGRCTAEERISGK
jgi:hypothetical protein